MEPDPSKLPRSVGIPIFSVLNPESKEKDPEKISNLWDENGGKKLRKILKKSTRFFSAGFSLSLKVYLRVYTLFCYHQIKDYLSLFLTIIF